MTLQECLDQAKTHLPDSPTPKLDLLILLQRILHVDESFLYAHGEKTLTCEQVAQLKNYLEQRRTGKPIAYIIGEKEFYSLTFKVNKNVLVPRPDTELLVDLVLEKTKKDRDHAILDLGTGSGAIALAIGKYRPHSRVIATDVCAKALTVAKQNAIALGIGNVNFIQSNWFAQVPNKKFDVIVSNPPYIAKQDLHLNVGELRQEPQGALVAEQEGLADLFHIIEHAGNFLHKGACLLLEHGYQQAKAVVNCMRNNGFSQIVTRQDLAGLDRVTFANCA